MAEKDVLHLWSSVIARADRLDLEVVAYHPGDARWGDYLGGVRSASRTLRRFRTLREADAFLVGLAWSAHNYPTLEA